MFLLIFMALLFLSDLFVVIKIYQSDTERERQSKKNLAILHHTGHRPLHTHWDDDGYLIDD